MPSGFFVDGWRYNSVGVFTLFPCVAIFLIAAWAEEDRRALILEQRIDRLCDWIWR